MGMGKRGMYIKERIYYINSFLYIFYLGLNVSKSNLEVYYNRSL